MSPSSIKIILALAVLGMSTANECRAQVQSQTDWPKSILTSGGTVINLYQPQVLSYSGTILKSRSVISVQDDGEGDPVFGVAWTTAKVTHDESGNELLIQSVSVDQLRIPDDTNRADNNYISAVMEVYFPSLVKSLPESEVRSSIITGREEEAISGDTSIAGPKVYFATGPTALVLIDGQPRLEMNERWGLNVVANSRNVIVQGKNGKYYLYVGLCWYSAPSSTGPYTARRVFLTKELRKIQQDLLKAARKADVPLDAADATARRIIVSTVPAVLIRTDGKPEVEEVAGTSIYQVKNAEDFLYYDKKSDAYYAKAGGSWYSVPSLKGGKDNEEWRPVAKVDLPVEILLAMDGAANAGDEYVPQTSRVDRGVTTTVDYDGPPRFKPIIGTNLEYATNTCSIVFRYIGQYYALDNGVWFIAGSPLGIWRVSDSRPSGLELITMLYRVYRAKFVYIYQTAPDYVYEGYLPGYDDVPADGCALAASYDNDWNDVAWGFDLDFVFGWGGGWLNSYYRFDRLNSYYGHMVYEGKRPGWHAKEYGPWAGWVLRGGVRPHPPGGWSQRTGGMGRYVGIGYGAPGSGGGTALASGSGSGSGSARVLHGLPSGGSGSRGYVSGGSGARSSQNAYSGGGSRSGGGGSSSGGSGGGGHVSSGGGGGGSGGGGSSAGGGSTHH